MKCPVCKTENLLMSEKKGVEIDYCPECRGVWLDRGELDKIIDRSTQMNHQTLANSKTQPQQRDVSDKSNRYDDYKRNKKHSKKNRVGDLLGDLFDF